MAFRLASLGTAVATLAGLAPGAAHAGSVPASPRLALAAVVAPGGRLAATPQGLLRPVRVQVRRGASWVRIGPAVTVVGGSSAFAADSRPSRMRLRAVGADGTRSRSVYVRVRPLTLAAVGDINLGDGPGDLIDRFGAGYPWAGVGPRLRAADIAFGNLECAISLRGSAQDKQFTFRGRPASVRAMRALAGVDVVNLANNHSGDFGRVALLDTLRTLRASSVVAVGAGATEAAAYRPQIVERLGLKVAFVGFSVILPFEFRAVGASPGTAWGFPARVARAVAVARRQADVVVATFHWGIERDVHESAQQRALARVALDAGATAVIGAHPHVLQPVRRIGARLVAYSLGNFVFAAHGAGTSSTGILELGLGRAGVLSSRLVPARIVAARPLLTG
jgi:poly-gamma-glutamate synthesis protein (capsule biosynthesis protein)